jgi:hypothetical protein
VAAAGAGSDSDDFLTINEFGPFDTDTWQNMGYLGMFVLALASQMCDRLLIYYIALGFEGLEVCFPL